METRWKIVSQKNLECIKIVADAKYWVLTKPSESLGDTIKFQRALANRIHAHSNLKLIEITRRYMRIVCQRVLQEIQFMVMQDHYKIKNHKC